jgi:hypothetical protein
MYRNQTISGGGGGSGGIGLNQTVSVYEGSGDGSTTAFNTGTTINAESLTWVFVDGVYQEKGTYSTSGSTVTFSTAPPNGTSVEVNNLSNVTTGGAFNHNAYNGDGSTTDFTLSKAPGSDTDLIVFIDGVYQNSDAFNVSSTTLSFDTAPANSTKVIAYTIGGVVMGKTMVVDTFNGDASTTAFTLSMDPTKEENTQVYVGGVYQPKGTYSLSGTTLTFSEAPPSATGNIEVNISQVTTLTEVGANSVTATSIAANAVGSAEIAANSVDSSELVTGSIDTIHIGDDQVTNAKLAVNSVSAVELAGNSVTSTQIAANQVGISELNLSEGTSGQVLTTDGSGTLSFSTVAGTTINNNADNRIITGSATANTLEGEANLTFDGTTTVINNTGNADSTLLKLTNTPSTAGTYKTGIEFWSNEGTANNQTFNAGRIYSEFNGSSYTNAGLTLGSASGGGTFNDELTLRNGNVGIGTTSPTSKLHAYHSTNASDTLVFVDNLQTSQDGTDYNKYGIVGQTRGADASWSRGVGVSGLGDAATFHKAIGVYAGLNTTLPTGFATDSALYADGNSLGNSALFMNGNVGIGTTSPSAPLHVDAAGMGDIYSGLIENSTTDTDHYNVVRFIQGASGSATGYIGTGGSATGNTAFRNSFVVGTQTSSPLVFTTNDTERLRIDSSGNLLVGKTATALSAAGIELAANNTLRATKANSASAEFNRTGTDGDIAIFWKNTSPVGSIGTYGGTCYMGGSGALGGFMFNGSIEPTRGASRIDATHDLGSTAYRFKDLYLSGGVVFNVAGGTGTSTSGTLDDYEEGTFTPSYTVGGGGSVTGVTSTNVGAYTKVGRMCTVTVRSFYVATSGTIPTYYRVTLPFTAATITNGMTGGGFGQETGQSGAGMMIKVDSGQTSAIIWKYDGTAVPANSYFELMFTYMTA